MLVVPTASFNAKMFVVVRLSLIGPFDEMAALDWVPSLITARFDSFLNCCRRFSVFRNECNQGISTDYCPRREPSAAKALEQNDIWGMDWSRSHEFLML